MSNPMVPLFQILGPSNGAYPGTVCLPQVPLPVNASVKAGDKATIQIVEHAQHGASLYSVSSIIFPFYQYHGSRISLTYSNRTVRRYYLCRSW